MHFTTLYLMRGKTLAEVSLNRVDREYGDKFCYACGEREADVLDWCDWFSIGGRWSDLLVAKKGIKGEKSWTNENEQSPKDNYSIVEVKDLKEPIEEKWVYSIAIDDELYQKEDKEFKQLLEQVNNKTFKGVVALIDNHD